MAYEGGCQLQDRFHNARGVLIEMFPCRRRPGRTYQGYIKALREMPAEALGALDEHLRSCHRQVSGTYWQRWGWVPFAVDGTRLEVPRTQANERALGCAGRHKSGPQLALTTLYHMGTGLPWAWQIGAGVEPEVGHLRSMLPVLPSGSLLVADAGFTGYQLFDDIQGRGVSFLIRVGSNMGFLTDLGLEVEVQDDIVWLWPFHKRSCRPMKLRLIRLQQGRRQMCLITNVLDHDQLTQETAAKFYQMRWGVEVFYRSFKRTLAHHKMRSANPVHARLELHFALTATLLLGLMTSDALIQKGKDPLCMSVALALRQLRRAMTTRQNWRRTGDLRVILESALKDGYHRRATKKARDWPHKKNDSPPGVPKVRRATPAECRRAARVCKAA